MSRVLARTGSLGTAPSSARVASASLHPWAWWSWAIAGAVAMTVANNPLLLALLISAVIFVVLQRRSDDPWARSVKAYLTLGAIIVTIRVLFQIFVGGVREGTMLFRLPEIPLPAWAAGIRLGGPVTLEALLFAVYDASRLAGLLICVGAANSLANPKRALRSLPAAFHEIATSLVIALTVAPQLIESGQRINRARKLRSQPPKGIRGALSLIVPVLEDAVEHSLALAAGMESRGYGRTRSGKKTDAATTIALITSMLAVTFGAFGLLGIPSQLVPGWGGPLVVGGRQFTVSISPWLVVIIVGGLAGWFGLRRAGTQLSVTRYRPDAWRPIESGIVALAVAITALSIWLSNHDPAMRTSTFPAEWPELTPGMLILVALVALPGIVTPAPLSEGDRR